MRSANSNNNNEPLRVALNRAIRLGRRGKPIEAIRILEPLARRYPRSAALHGCLGNLHFEQGDLAKAAASYRHALKLNPKSELASVGLFHSLWSMGAANDAFAEMRRFLSGRESDEYATLLRDLAIEGALAPRLPTAGAA